MHTHTYTNERVIDANCACSLGAAAIRLIAAITRAPFALCLVGPTLEMPLLDPSRELLCMCARRVITDPKKPGPRAATHNYWQIESNDTHQGKTSFRDYFMLGPSLSFSLCSRLPRGRPAPENHSPPRARTSCPKTYNWHIPAAARAPRVHRSLASSVRTAPSQSHLLVRAERIFAPHSRWLRLSPSEPFCLLDLINSRKHCGLFSV